MAVSASGSMVLTGVTVVAGQWSKGNLLPARAVIGLGFTAIVIALLSEADPEFGAQFALLVLIGAIFVYGPSIAKKLGVAR